MYIDPEYKDYDDGIVGKVFIAKNDIKLRCCPGIINTGDEVLVKQYTSKKIIMIALRDKIDNEFRYCHKIKRSNLVKGEII